MATQPDDPDRTPTRDVASIYAARAASAPDRRPWVHPLCQTLPTDRRGPLLALINGTLLTVDMREVAISHNDGRTWPETYPAVRGQNPEEPASCYVLETSSGALVMVYLDRAPERSHFGWDAETGEPAEGCRLDMCAVRSLDGGRTWSERQHLLRGYHANFFGLIQTRSGRLVTVAEHLVSDPGRWVVCSLVSEDDGVTWRRSNFIDLGGHGHHDGATEPTVAELSDGRLLMLIRTNLGRFWQALSDDGGRTWRTVGPSPIDASSSPGHLLRLQSGRLVLVWNRRDPEGETWPLGKPGPWHSEFPASWHREELSIALSEDDGRTWSAPLVIARLRGGQLSYPQVLERRAGELWVVAGFASAQWFNEQPVPLGVRIQETALLEAAPAR